MNTTHFDLIAIGAGSGGLAVARKAAQLGRKVAVVEARELGGTCVNRGCVPKKVLWHAAQLAHAVEDAPDFGISTSKSKTNWRQLVQGRNDYVGRIQDNWQNNLQLDNISIINGEAEFLSKREISVNGQVYSADHIVIATGSQPIIPPLPGAELGISSDGFFALEEQPEKVAIIGGGYIAVELAGLMNALGSSVTVVALENRLLERFDVMLGEELQQHMQSQGIEVHTGFQASELSKDESGKRLHSVKGDLLSGFDVIIWAVGRSPNTRGLNLDAAGIRYLHNGTVPSDEYENTNVPGIYAIGDITGKAALTPVAVSAGRKLAERLFADKPESRQDYEMIPSVVFAHPPVASIGQDEASAVETHDDGVTVYESHFTPMRYALSSKGYHKTRMKLVCAGPEEKVVGIHLIGDAVDEMLQGFAVAVKMGANKADLDATVAIHPGGAEELVTMKNPSRSYPASINVHSLKKAG